MPTTRVTLDSRRLSEGPSPTLSSWRNTGRWILRPLRGRGWRTQIMLRLMSPPPPESRRRPRKQ